MIAGVLVLSVMVSLSAGQAAPQATPGRIVPAFEGRMFPIRSAAAWPLVQQRLTELGFATDKLDRKNQALLTKWRDVGAKGMAWFPAKTLIEGYVAERVRFQVFVSPFAEPARLYVGSIVEGREQMGSPATAYNVPKSNASLMAQIVAAITAEGIPISPDPKRRKEAAVSLLKEGADDCLRNGPPNVGPIARGDPRLTEPRKIPLSEHEFIYPATARHEGKAGVVRVEFVIPEDGAVTDLRVLDAPSGYRFEGSAMGVTSLLLYSPTRISGCPVAAFLTYTVRFRR